MAIHVPQYLSYEIQNAEKAFYVLQNTIETKSASGSKITEMAELKKRIDDLKDHYEVVLKTDRTGVSQKVSWWINPLNKTLKDILRRDYGVDHPSNGFLKMFEMLAMSKPYSLHVANEGKIRVFANAELPGAMIFAANHFYQQNQIEMDFVFSSLIDPEDPNKLGDQYGLVEKYPKQFIPYMKPGEKHTGNVADPSEVEFIVKMVSSRFSSENRGKVDFYFADGGINVDYDYNNQDRENAHVNLGQVICGLLTLRKGGLFITKQYNFTGSWTWTLDLLVASLFSKFCVIKPATSRHSNSECYLVGFDYVGVYPGLENYLMDFLRSCHKDNDYIRNILPPADLDAPVQIQKNLVDDFDVFMSQLIHFTQEAISEHNGRVGFLVKKIEKISPRVLRNWISRVAIQPIAKSQNLQSTR